MLSRISSYFSGNGYQQPEDGLKLEKSKKFAQSVNSVVSGFPKSTPAELHLCDFGTNTRIGLTFPGGKMVYVNFYIIGSEKYKISRNDQKSRYESYHDGDGSEALVDYLTGYTATLGDCKIGLIVINWYIWPSIDLLNIAYIRNIPEWGILARKEIYDDFMEYMNQKTDGIPVLHIVQTKDFTLPATFYKSKVFRGAEKVVFGSIGDTIMDEDDFLMAKSRILEVKSSLISDKTFNEKLHQWFNSESKNWKRIALENCDNKAERIINKDAILANLPYTKLEEQIGHEIYQIVRKNGDTADIKFPVPPFAVKATFKCQTS